MSTIQPLCFSDEFVISCGTVTVDLKLRKVLLIRWNKTGEFLLPKGRKNTGETLYDAALRETFEETGYEPTLLPLPIPTLSTSATDDTTKADGVIPLVTEPIAVNQRLSGPSNQLKIIFWFAAQADSTLPKRTGTQQPDEDFDTLWIPMDEVERTLTFDLDRQIARKVIDASRHLHTD